MLTLNLDIPMTMHLWVYLFLVKLICATAWRSGWAPQIHTSFPVDFASSINWTEQFYSHTFQLLMWMLMLNSSEEFQTGMVIVQCPWWKFQDSTKQDIQQQFFWSWSCLGWRFAQLDTVFCWSETLCIYLLVPKIWPMYMSAKWTALQ